MREVTVIQRHCEGSEQVQELLASCLDFPAYYGGNFAALDDCLGDIDEPTRIVIDRDDTETKRDASMNGGTFAVVRA